MEFVYDRTAEDVAEKTAKGVLNASDLNRIEGNTEELAELIETSVSVKSWEVGDLPRVSDYLRIRENTQAVRDGYPVLSTTPAVPEQPLNTYGKWNDIEKILFDVCTLYEGTEEARIYCGDDEYAGEGE